MEQAHGETQGCSSGTRAGGGQGDQAVQNIENPDELKTLEYQDFKFDVPLSGAITFWIMFEPGVLPEEFPQPRERRTRSLKKRR